MGCKHHGSQRAVKAAMGASAASTAQPLSAAMAPRKQPCAGCQGSHGARQRALSRQPWAPARSSHAPARQASHGLSAARALSGKPWGMQGRVRQPWAHASAARSHARCAASRASARRHARAPAASPRAPRPAPSAPQPSARASARAVSQPGAAGGREAGMGAGAGACHGAVESCHGHRRGNIGWVVKPRSRGRRGSTTCMPGSCTDFGQVLVASLAQEIVE
ncbi:translation initiation factor IF-2-like, partial [Juglans microcarpa x Juglans regia]|uniref:translation initiation factor IF-2-like n=1 Tax=Juglans microcarpa x Juglans regia TaxID=2249226 RepID=UPI001B7E8EFF